MSVSLARCGGAAAHVPGDHETFMAVFLPGARTRRLLLLQDIIVIGTEVLKYSLQGFCCLEGICF